MDTLHNLTTSVSSFSLCFGVQIIPKPNSAFMSHFVRCSPLCSPVDAEHRGTTWWLERQRSVQTVPTLFCCPRSCHTGSHSKTFHRHRTNQRHQDSKAAQPNRVGEGAGDRTESVLTRPRSSGASWTHMIQTLLCEWKLSLTLICAVFQENEPQLLRAFKLLLSFDKSLLFSCSSDSGFI